MPTLASAQPGQIISGFHQAPAGLAHVVLPQHGEANYHSTSHIHVILQAFNVMFDHEQASKTNVALPVPSFGGPGLLVWSFGAGSQAASMAKLTSFMVHGRLDREPNDSLPGHCCKEAVHNQADGIHYLCLECQEPDLFGS